MTSCSLKALAVTVAPRTPYILEGLFMNGAPGGSWSDSPTLAGSPIFFHHRAVGIYLGMGVYFETGPF